MTPETTRRDRAAQRDRMASVRAFREAFVLPVLFLTVTLGGGFRAVPGSGQFQFVPPPLIHLLLAVLVLAVLVRSAVLDPATIFSSRRRGLELVCGAVVVGTLFGASAQAINAVVPDAGLWHLLGVLVLGLQLANTIAIRPDPARALQSMLVSLGGMLVVKHVVLAGLADPERGLARRVLAALLEGVTLGELRVEPSAPATGYVALATVLLYFVGLLLVWRAFPLEVSPGGALVTRVESEAGCQPPQPKTYPETRE